MSGQLRPLLSIVWIYCAFKLMQSISAVLHIFNLMITTKKLICGCDVECPSFTNVARLCVCGVFFVVLPLCVITFGIWCAVSSSQRDCTSQPRILGLMSEWPYTEECHAMGYAESSLLFQLTLACSCMALCVLTDIFVLLCAVGVCFDTISYEKAPNSEERSSAALQLSSRLACTVA